MLFRSWYARNGYQELYAVHGGGEPSYSGKTVTRDSALSHSVVWACALTLAQTLGGLPLHLYRRLEGDAKEKATSHPLYRILHDSPNDEMSAFEFREIMMLHAVLEGNAYSRIVRQASGRIVALMPPWNPAARTSSTCMLSHSGATTRRYWCSASTKPTGRSRYSRTRA